MESFEKEKERVITVGLHTGSRDAVNDTTDESMRELEELVKTAGGEVVCETVQNRPSPDAGTYIGTGKLEEIKEAVSSLGAELVVFDDELSPGVRQLQRHKTLPNRIAVEFFCQIF